jgi:hypothetical protein
MSLFLTERICDRQKPSTPVPAFLAALAALMCYTYHGQEALLRSTARSPEKMEPQRSQLRLSAIACCEDIMCSQKGQELTTT